jgi:hypothetical protein
LSSVESERFNCSENGGVYQGEAQLDFWRLNWSANTVTIRSLLHGIGWSRILDRIAKLIDMKSKWPHQTVRFLVVAILLAGCVLFAQSGETYKVRLTPVPIDTRMMSRIAGSGSATGTLAGNKLTITGNFSGLRSAAKDAQIHRAAKGIRGPAVLDLMVSKATSGSINGSLELTAAQADDLRNSRFYIQVDSEGAPEGNLWGWLLR